MNTNEKVTAFTLFRHRPSKLYVHRDGQFLDFNGRMGYKIKPNDTHQCQVTYEKVVMLSRRRPDGTTSCTHCRFDDCMYGAVTDQMIADVGCTVPWVPQNGRVCTDPADVNASFWMHWSRITNQKRDCLRPCETLVGSVGAKNVERNKRGYAEFYLYFTPTTMTL